MVKFKGKNGIKMANLLSAIREKYNFTYKQSIDCFVYALTCESVIYDIYCIISGLEDYVEEN